MISLNGEVPMTGDTIRNLDDVQLTLDDWHLQYMHHIIERGYTEIMQCSGDLGASELCMYTGNVGRKPILAFIDPHHRYAYVLMDNGRWIDGSFWSFGNGRISLS